MYWAANRHFLVCTGLVCKCYRVNLCSFVNRCGHSWRKLPVWSKHKFICLSTDEESIGQRGSEDFPDGTTCRVPHPWLWSHRIFWSSRNSLWWALWEKETYILYDQASKAFVAIKHLSKRLPLIVKRDYKSPSIVCRYFLHFHRCQVWSNWVSLQGSYW